MMPRANMPQWVFENLANINQREEPPWLADFREYHRDYFLKTGLPSQCHERWKYTNFTCLQQQTFSVAKPFGVIEKSVYEKVKAHRLSADNIFLVCVDGFYIPQLSELSQLPQGSIVCHLREAIYQYTELIKAHWPPPIDAKRYPFAGLNAALSCDGMFFYIPDGCEFKIPVHILMVATDQHACIACPQQIIILGESSKLSVLEEYIAWSDCPYFMNVLTSMTVSAGAHLEYYKYQKQTNSTIHFAHTLIQQHSNSTVNHVNVSSSNKFTRDDLLIQLNDIGANCYTSGFYQLHQDEQYVEHHVDIEHRAPHSRSEMLYKGILDRKSQAVFNGRLHVVPYAQKIFAHQENHHLLLANQAQAYSKPELEIYADDVQCKHGATTGELDQDALFYLRSRGIDYRESLSILLRGFADEIIQRIKHEGIKKHIQQDEVAV
ncbi:MAG TPA: Fe-S cluster assembly protein SufD [Gammaproteobacteria bacterium]|nr:Fe-S cluster assembly protein SufD [Gammaproteobacteria bacterium]